MCAPSLCFTQSKLALAFLLLLCAASTLLAQDSWEMRSPTPTGNRIGSYVYGNGQFVGVGESGEIVTSPDGATWTRRDSGVREELERVVFGANKFVAISAESLLTSTDGAAWTRQAGKFLRIAFGNGVFIALIQPAVPLDNVACQVLTSPDAVTWTPRVSFSSIPADLLFANGVFVAPDTGGGIRTTSDGITWNAVAVREITSSTVFFTAGNGRFLLSYGGGGYLSTDGLTWRNVTTQMPHAGFTVPVPNLGHQSSIGFADGYFYIQQARHARDAYAQYRSPDGENWTSLPSDTYNFDFDTLASGGGISVVSKVARLYSSANPTGYAIHSSTDGITWIKRSSEIFRSSVFSLPNYQLIYAFGRFFAGGKSSNDGINWADCGFEPTHAAGDLAFRIATNTSPGSVTSTTTVAVSADGLTSNVVDVKMPTPRAIAFGNVYVMVGDDGNISSSTDGFTWSARTSGTTKHLNAVTYAFNRFVAVGVSGAFLTSPDGHTWTPVDSAGLIDFDLNHMVPGTDRIAVAANSRTSSTTPITLTLDGGVSVQVIAEPAFSAMTFFNGTFLAISTRFENPASPYGYYPQLWKSTDAVSWTEIPIHLGPVDGPSFFTPSLTVGNDTAALLAQIGLPYYTKLYPALLQTPYTESRSPAITDQPWPATVARGETVSFAVGATGTGPLSYQWFHNGQAMANATSSVLTLTLVKDTDAGDYSVKVTNNSGSATSSTGRLTVQPPVPLTIIRQPVGGTLYESQYMTLSVNVTGSGPINYQWRHNGTPIVDATSATYSLWPSPLRIDSQTGSFDVVVSAPHSTVTSETVVLTWGGPTVTLAPTGLVTMTVGQTLKLTATATGTAPFTYRWSQIGPHNTFSDATGPTLILPFLTTADSSPYSVEVTDANGQRAQASVNVGVMSSGTDPTSSTATAEDGQDLTLRAGLADPLTWNYLFQWRHNGTSISGATTPTYTIHNFSKADEGSYDVVVTASDGTTSIHSAIKLSLDGSHSRLVNLSARAFAGSDENTLIVGFVLSGDPSAASPNVLVRSIGPTLLGMGVNGPLADPAIRVVDRTASLVAENDNWSTVLTTGRGIAATAADMAKCGAFALPFGSRDSAVMVHEPPAGPSTALVSAISSGTGIVLNEIYGPVSGTQRLVNLSARARVSSGDSILIAGFVITGTTPLRILIRGVGPTLSTQGIGQPLLNPTITLYNVAGQVLHNNDNWGQALNAPDIRIAMTTTGAFPLNEGSHDAAMLETLAPGVYTVHVTSADTSSGVALVEIYEAR